MVEFLLSRIGRALFTILLVLTISFAMLASTGDPAVLILSADATPAELDAFREQHGLNAPVWRQFARYLLDLLNLDLGTSLRDGRSVAEVVSERIPLTLAITVPALLIKIGLGIPAGIHAALHRNSAIDRLTMTLSIAGHTVPNFVLALVLVLVFAVRLGWLPSSGHETWRHAILPVITLGMAGAAMIARFTRSAMVEVLGKPYIRTGLAKGLSWRDVVRRHALPNAAIPTLTMVGFMVGSLIGGAVVVETVFAWPGLGQLVVVSVTHRDLAVVQAVLLLVATCMVSANLVVDLAYGFFDPRLRTHVGKAS